MDVIVGIDLGTTNSEVAIVRDGQPYVLEEDGDPILPSFVGAYALVLMFGRVGVVSQVLRAIGIPFGSIYGVPGLVAVYTLSLFPYVLLPTVAAFKAVDVSIEEAAQNLGSTRWRTFRTVIFPVVLPAVLAGALLVFMDTLESFGVPFVLAAFFTEPNRFGPFTQCRSVKLFRFPAHLDLPTIERPAHGSHAR